MIIIRWIAYVIGAECLIVLTLIPRSIGTALIAVLFFICFITVCWTFGAFARSDSNPKGTS